MDSTKPCLKSSCWGGGGCEEDLVKANRDNLTLSRFFPETSNTPHKTVSAHWATGERKWSPFGLTPECVQSCPGKKIRFLFISSYCVEKIFPVAQMVKELACKAGDLGWIPGWEDPLEEEMTAHSSVPAWRIHGWRSPGYSPRGHKEWVTTVVTNTAPASV